MTDYRGLLQGQNGLLVRQRLRLKNFCPCMLQNDYDVGTFPANLNPTEVWEDSVFKANRGLMYMKEESECYDKCCCGNFRAFTMHTYAGSQGEQEVLRYKRPFKCPILCCCFLPWPQEIHTHDGKSDAKIGSVYQDWRCLYAFIGRRYWKVVDGNGATTHIVEQNICCNENMFAPNCFCKVNRFDIKSADETQVVGSIENIWPGCSFRSLFFKNLIDNYRVTFPQNASPEDKANIMGALLLIDFMLFSNAPNQDQGVEVSLG